MADVIEQIKVPDIGGAENVDVIEVAVKPGDVLEIETPLLTLEGDKATMDIPSPVVGVVETVLVSVGDKVSEGTAILTVKVSGTEAKSVAKDTAVPVESAPPAVEKPVQQQTAAPTHKAESVIAGPAVRRTAREIGVDLSTVKGSGDKGRITRDDLKRHVQSAMRSGGSGSGVGLDLLPWPTVDFAKFGPVTAAPLSKIKRISGANLHRNWVSIPHVTQFEEADITELEAFRQEQKTVAAQQGVKLTPLVFIMKAVVSTLKLFPHFNASLDASGEALVLKQYYHIGVAVDTPNGLVVPVIRDVDRKGIYELARELGEVSQKAREKGLSVAEMQGGCFTISSLGGIGGTAFTPIINAPEVAILGVSRHLQKPVFLKAENQFVPRLMLPLSLSYDHRVIDGADGARFIVSLANRLSDIRQILL